VHAASTLVELVGKVMDLVTEVLVLAANTFDSVCSFFELSTEFVDLSGCCTTLAL